MAAAASPRPGSRHGLLYGCECDSKRIESVSVYRPKMALSLYKNIRAYHFLFLLLYLIIGSFVLKTIGEPYKLFLIKADQQGFQVMEGSTRYKAELEHALHDLNDPNRRTKKIGWTDWMDYDIEELAAEKKRDLERNVLDSLPKHMRVPNKYAPAFWPSLLTGILATFHALVLLLQVWSISFAVFMNFTEVSTRNLHIPPQMLRLPDDDDHDEDDDESKTLKSSNGSPVATAAVSGSANAAVAAFPNFQIRHPPSHLPTHARIVPAKRGEKHVLVPLEYYPVLGMTFEYHRRRYVYHVNDDHDDNDDNQSPGIWCKIRCRTNFPLKILGSTTLSETSNNSNSIKKGDRKPWSGFSDAHSLATGQIRYGPNYFSVKQPSFSELYKAQLLNPFSVFQVFCVLLWAIDDYIIYSFFSLFMVLMFEGTVVFQRLRSLQALRGMGNPSRPVLVHRCGHWTSIETTQLLPGDILSLTRVKPHVVQRQINAATGKPMMMNRRIEDEGGDVVPADLLLLRGSTVVNEASLTGESIPQMKEGLGEEYTMDDEEGNGANENGNKKKTNSSEPDECLSIKNKHKMNVVYAGTKMLQCKGDPMASALAAGQSSSTMGPFLFRHISPPPDGGCVCFVLRTGFASAQGKLVRMIEGSQEKVKGHERETGLLLLLLCLFAIASSSYVLYHGAQDEKRSKYELLLHCILIVTSVIRPELPMQMAMAVNNSLMTLMKMNVFCTEPYRVPTAGKLDACLFDKTGTLTTDELVAVGICTAKTLQKVSKSEKPGVAEAAAAPDLLTPMMKVASEEASAALVLAGCHSLVVVDGETTGDPLESASLKSMHWQLDLTTHKAVPMPATEKRAAGQVLCVNGSTTNMDQVEILMRHHFSSKLQRMSCVIQAGTTTTRGGGSMHKFSVAKGSPEAIGRLLGNKPDGYDDKSQYLAKQGYRVIALAYKPLDTEASVSAAMETRAECEANLIFAGFIAFTCMVRKDTADVLKRLKEGGMSIAMVTGDALLTAIHVAREVSIFRELDESSDGDKVELEEKNQELKAFLERKRRGKDGAKQSDATKKKHKAFKPIAYLDLTEKGLLYWKSYDDNTKVDDYVADRVPLLAETYDLATSGKCLAAAYEQDEGTTKTLAHIKVFARMTPDAKETVIECLHSVGKLCLMCGDGANDVGALKQADVGVALLSGFGNLNVDKAEGEVTKKKEKEDKLAPVAIMSHEHLEAVRALPVSLIKMRIRSLGTDPDKYPDLVEKEDLVQLYQIKAREVAVQRHDKKNELDRAKMTKAEQAAESRREMQQAQQRMMERCAELEAQGVKWATFKAMQEMYAEQAAKAREKKQGMMQAGGIEGSAASLAAQLDEMESADGLPMVKLGDASIAAPFTSKMPSIKSCVDIVRQGRCTLVSSIQMYQIMALQCLISSYSLSVLYLDGVKYGDSQMTAMGLLGSVSFMSVSRSKPLDKLSRVRPLTSIFHPALFISLLGQFSIHLTTMLLAVYNAKKHLPPDYEPDLDGRFKPGILNTVVFLVSSVQQVTVFVVNLQGRPFMTGVTENTPLLWSLVATFILTFMFASETVPGLNRYFQLVSFPDEAFRDFILSILFFDLMACFVWDRLMKFSFARDILFASFEGTSKKDVFTLVRTFVIIGFLMYSFMGNSETWDVMLEMEMNLTAAMNETDGGGTARIIQAVANESIQAVRDEF